MEGAVNAALAVVEFTVDCLTAFRLQPSPAQAQPSFVLGGCASLGLPQRTHSVEAGHCLLIDKGAPLGSSIVLDCGWRNVSTGIAHLIVSRSYRYWRAIDLRPGSLLAKLLRVWVRPPLCGAGDESRDLRYSVSVDCESDENSVAAPRAGRLTAI